MARLHCSSPIWPGLLALVLTSCFDDPPSLMESESSSGSGASTTTLTTSESTTTGEATDTLADTTDGTTGSESSGTGSESSSTGSESSSTGPGPECDADDGQPDEACTAGTPFCVGGSCVPCSGGGSCGALDPTTPVCGADDVCRPCVEHSECPNDAGCHLFEGTCLPADSVYYVNPDFMCGPGDATEAFPACSIQQAVAAVGADPEATIRLVENVYLEPMTIANGQVLAVLGEGETTVVTNSEQPTVTVDGTAYFSVVDIQNFHILGTGIESSGDLWLDNSMIRNNDTGLLSVAGRVTLRRSRVLGSLSVGIRLQGNQPVTLINSIVADGGFGPDPGGIVALGPSPIDVLYSTIANNSGTNGGAIDCGPGNVTVRNSIVISSAFANAINCGGGNSVTYSVVRDAEFEGNPTNLPLTDIADLAFDENYSLGAGSVAIDVAQWEEDDPATDINGSARPAVPGTPDDAGADRAGG